MKVKKFTPKKVTRVEPPSDPLSPHPRLPEMRLCDFGTAVYHAKVYGLPHKTDDDVLKMHRRLKAANPLNYAASDPVPSNYERAVQAATVSRAFAGPPQNLEKIETGTSRPSAPSLESAIPPRKGAAVVQKFAAKEKGPGVIDTIIRVLTEEAGKAKPMTKAGLLKRLVKLIPGREPEKMASTIRAQLAASGLKAKGVDIRHDGKKGDDRGYWVRKAK